MKSAFESKSENKLYAFIEHITNGNEYKYGVNLPVQSDPRWRDWDHQRT